MAERLESKTAYISTILERCGYDWEQTFFVMLARHLGAPANSDAMEKLAFKDPFKHIAKAWRQDRSDRSDLIWCCRNVDQKILQQIIRYELEKGI